MGFQKKRYKEDSVTLEKKGFLKKEVRVYADGKIQGVVFSPEPLVKKLRALGADHFNTKNIQSFYESQTEYKLQA